MESPMVDMILLPGLKHLSIAPAIPLQFKPKLLNPLYGLTKFPTHLLDARRELVELLIQASCQGVERFRRAFIPRLVRIRN